MEKKTLLRIFLVVSFLIIGIISGFLFFTRWEKFHLQGKKNLEEKTSIPNELLIYKQGGELPNKELFYERIGKVEELTSEFIIIDTGKEILPGITKVKGIIAPETKVFKLFAKKNSETGKLEFKEEPFSFSEIKIGDEVILVTQDNVEEKTEIKVIKIRVVQKEI